MAKETRHWGITPTNNMKTLKRKSSSQEEENQEEKKKKKSANDDGRRHENDLRRLFQKDEEI